MKQFTKVDETYRSNLISLIKEKIKLPEVLISGTLNLSSSEPNGITVIKNVLKKINESSALKKYMISIKYISAPNYKLDVIANDYKAAEKIITEISNEVISLMKKSNGTAEFTR